MGVKLNDKETRGGKAYKQALFDLFQVIYKRGTIIPYYFDFIFYSSSLGRQQGKHLKVIHDFTAKVIKDRTEYIDKHGVNLGEDTEDDALLYKKKKKVAMLDLLITAAKENLIDDKGIQEEVDTFMFEVSKIIINFYNNKPKPVKFDKCVANGLCCCQVFSYLKTTYSKMFTYCCQ